VRERNDWKVNSHKKREGEVVQGKRHRGRQGKGSIHRKEPNIKLLIGEALLVGGKFK